MPDQKTMQARCLGGLYIMWVPKLLLSPVKIRNFGQKSAKFGPKMAFLAHFVPGIGQICFLAHLSCQFIWCFIGWWLWRAGCISQDIYLLNGISGVKKSCCFVELYQLRIHPWQTVLKIFSFDRQKLGWQTVKEQGDCPY